MAKSNLVPPFIEDPSTSRAINELYRQVNKLLTSISPNAENYDKEALEGSVRAIYEGGDNYRIEGKTSNGWVGITAQKKLRENTYSNMPRIMSSGALKISNDIFSDGPINITTQKNSTINGSIVHLIGDSGIKLDSAGTIELNADNGQVTIKDDTASHFLFDCDNTALTIYDDQDEGDLFKIQIAQHGATTISTVDDNAAAGHLTLDPDGKIICKSNTIELGHFDAAIDATQFLIETSPDTYQKYAAFQAEGGDHSQLRLYEAGGDSANDYVQLKCLEHGETTLTTVDAAAAAAHLTLNPDGHIKFITSDGETDSVEYIIGSNTYAAFSAEDGSYSQLKMYENGGESSSDYFSISVAEHGETTLTTVDAAAANANLNMTIDGDILLDSADEIVIDHTNRFKFKKAGTEYVKFDVDGSSQFTMFEQGGATTDDYLLVNVATNGATTLQTVDAAGADADLTLFPDGDLILKVGSGGTFMKEAASAATDKLGYGQLWVKNATPNELYFTNAAGNDIQITSGSSIAGGGGGTSRWSNTSGGYKTNNNSSTTYYFQYYPNYHVWANLDSSPTTLSYTDSYAYNFCAPADGALTNITVTCRASDTGATDPLKFYVFKGVPSNEATTVSLTQIGVTGTITPVSAKQMHLSTDISSSNTFSAGDKLWVMLKKDSTSGNQDLYFAVTISGTYS